MYGLSIDDKSGDLAWPVRETPAKELGAQIFDSGYLAHFLSERYKIEQH